ncbi:GNAT family N-acetyltransferase [Histidinibacterium lentulum]|uniref:N-acetyltransferase n=1 Tax=Histidinibacterium lentulum TaxID=2480588 RepID=A0A3N2R7R0_9RHOB|nr:GNAT family N-acetyltransferase [Histidinibacterium lentulum]ROU03448.1 N-acetyltransferase [Histidinibacterium lentulum]
MLTIRPATRGDLAALDALLARSYPRLLKADYPPSVLVTALPLISRANPALLGTGTYFVAEDATGTLLGAGGWTRGRPAPGQARQRRGNVRHVVTDDRTLRQGIGRAIMERTFDSARAAGATCLHCLSTRTAQPFYAALGFTPLGETEISLAPGIGFPAIAMLKELTPGGAFPGRSRKTMT